MSNTTSHSFSDTFSMQLAARNDIPFAWMVVALFAAACWLWIQRWLQRSSKDPKTWPIFGCQWEASRNYDRLLDWITEHFSDEHRTVKMSFLSRRSFLTVDPDNVEYILKTNFANFPKGRESHFRLQDMHGNGILNTDGEMWITHRKIASFEFSTRKLRALSTNAYRDGALKLTRILENIARSNEVTDLQDLLLRLTFDTICKVVFGAQMDSLSSIGTQDPLAAAIDNVHEMITRRYVFPWWRVQRFFNLGSEKLLKQELLKINSFFFKTIRERKVELQDEHQPEERQDLLSRFMLNRSFVQGTGLTDGELRDAIFNFVFAGRDTTATTLSWFLYCMCTNPDKADRVYEETLRLEQHPAANVKNFQEFADLLTYESVQKLHYLHAALTETLRLHPAVPRDGKVALNVDTLPDGTKLKGGDQVAYIPYAMGRMEFLWGKDAHEFKPERWLKDGIFQPESPFKLSAFQAGPRMCLGRDAAYLQMKITAALLMRFFRFDIMPGHPVKYRMMMVMLMKYGLRVHVRTR